MLRHPQDKRLQDQDADGSWGLIQSGDVHLSTFGDFWIGRFFRIRIFRVSTPGRGPNSRKISWLNGCNDIFPIKRHRRLAMELLQSNWAHDPTNSVRMSLQKTRQGGGERDENLIGS